MERWWGSPDTYRVIDCAADFRVGGQWSLGVRLPDGKVLPAGGEFIELDCPNRIVQTRRYDWDHPALGPRVTTIAYTLDRIPGGTRMTVRHDGFCGIGEAANEHPAGWERFLGWLAAYLQPDRVSAIIAGFRAQLKDPDKPFALLVRFRVKDGTQQKLESAFAATGVHTRNEAGVIAYDLNRDAGDSGRCLVYERWKSLADLEAHLRTAYIGRLMDITDEVLDGEAQFHVLIPALEGGASYREANNE